MVRITKTITNRESISIDKYLQEMVSMNFLRQRRKLNLQEELNKGTRKHLKG